MDEETENQSNMPASSNNASLKDTLKTGSPDEVKERVKETVERGIAAVAGALEGFNRGTEKNKLPEQTKGAIHQAAETTKSTVSSVTEEIGGLREPLREAGQKLSQTARDVSGTLREQVDETKSAVRGAGSGSASGSGSEHGSRLGYGSGSEHGSEFDAGSQTERSMGMGGSELGTGSSREASGQGSEMPDISRTPLAQPDSKLVGKDLTAQNDE